MTLRTTTPFDLVGFPVDTLDAGTSVLVSGDDMDALVNVFGDLVGPSTDHSESSVVVGTNGVDSVVRRVDRRRSADGQLHVITEPSQRVPRGPETTSVDDIGDMTGLGMHLSDAITDTGYDRFRTGIFLCSDICRHVDDIRSVYRFLNTSFLSELRRNEAIGVCAVQTDADVQTDMDSVVKSMSSSFDMHLALTDVSRGTAQFDVGGWDELGDSVTIS